MNTTEYQVTLQPSGHTFKVAIDETILDAALRQGIGLPYGCRNGACGSCKGKIVSGEFDFGVYQERTLRAEEKAEGKALFCVGKPLSDLTLEVKEIGGTGDIQIRTLPCRVEKMEKVAPDVAVLSLKLPAQERMQYFAGQYVDILLKDGKRRSYSMANPPHDDEYVELHVRSMVNGTFTESVFNKMKEKDILRFEGPLGTFFMREDSDKPMILVASGTGFAPIKSIIEHAFHLGTTRQMVLYWGGRRPADLYMAERAGKWQQEHDNFSFIPVVSDALTEDDWRGRTGFVHRAVMADFPDLSGYQVYACGAPVVVESAHKDFTTHCRLPEDEFFSDAFTPSVDPGPVTT